ncbi:RNA polymerase sigma factor [Streptacidiphilus cavernicola]|uniref:RNA polymerase sigma factor n=1 Tax=Streptacidiphilus cavernicola TaxID=3342716 RepID=A0ABV6VTB2_9ACTN
MPAEHPTAPPTRDPAGFAAFYEQQFDTVLGFVARRVDSPHLAADLTADIFVAALENADTYDARRGAPVAWLYGISRNVISAHFRGSARELHAVARITGRRLLDDQDVSVIEARIDAARAARRMAGAHAALSDPLREVLDLVALDGLTVREAAQALGISSTSARVRLHRARKALLGVEQTESQTESQPRTGHREAAVLEVTQ